MLIAPFEMCILRGACKKLWNWIISCWNVVACGSLQRTYYDYVSLYFWRQVITYNKQVATFTIDL